MKAICNELRHDAVSDTPLTAMPRRLAMLLGHVLRVRMWRAALQIAGIGLIASALNAGTVYVSQAAQGANTGTSWHDAYTDLGIALSESRPGDVLWIAQGEYRPGNPAAGVEQSFVIPGGVNLLGGFSATEVSDLERRPALHPTILTGDLAADDEPGFYNVEENARTVVRIESVMLPVVIDGVTIRGGQGSAEGVPGPQGGGLHIAGASLTLRGCHVIENTSLAGAGAVIAQGAHVLVESCTFAGNKATQGGGAGLLTVGSAEVYVAGSMFRDNMTGTTGTILCEGTSAVTVVTSAFVHNVASQGAAAFFHESCVAKMDRCRIIGNESVAGGALVLSTADVFHLSNTEFISNVSYLFGASALTCKSHGTIRNCTLAANTCYSDLDFSGGAIEASSAVVVLENTIAWGNESQNIPGNPQVTVGGPGGAIQVCSSLVEGLLESYCGQPAIDADPLFVNLAGADGVLGSDDDTTAISQASPCVDSGAYSGSSGAVDVAGMPRDLDGNLDGLSAMDIGAHEFSHVAITLSKSTVRVGESVELTVAGTRNMLGYVLVALQRGVTALPPFGSLLFDPSGGFSRMGVGLLPAVVEAKIGPGVPVPLTVIVQGLAFSSSTGFGNLSNAVTLEVWK